MSTIPKFDADAALRAIQARTPAKAAKPAKVAPESSNFSNFSDFSSPPPERDGLDGALESRREWGDELSRSLHKWLSVHPPDVWRAARVWEHITPPLERLETLLWDYETTGEPGDRKAAVFAANAVAAAAASISQGSSWKARTRSRSRRFGAS